MWMMNKQFQTKIYRNYKSGTTTRGSTYEYSLGYNPMSETHTWIIRRSKGTLDWEWFMPLDKSIR